MKERKLPPNGHTMGKPIKPSVLTLQADWQGLIPKLPIGDLEPEGCGERKGGSYPVPATHDFHMGAGTS